MTLNELYAQVEIAMARDPAAGQRIVMLSTGSAGEQSECLAVNTDHPQTIIFSDAD